MLQSLTKYANWKFILPLFLGQLYFAVSFFPTYNAKIDQIAGEKIDVLDVRQAYTFEEATELLTKMKPEGRAIYKTLKWGDMIYPIFYGGFFFFVLLYFLNTMFESKPKMLYFALVPIGAMLFDYLENINHLLLLNRFPDITEGMVSWGSVMTQLKWLFVMISFGMTLGLLFVWGIRKMKASFS